MNRSASCALLAIILSACAAPAPSIPTAQIHVEVPSSPSALETPSPQILVDPPVITFVEPQYILDLSFDYAAHYLYVDEIIIYTNNSTLLLDQLQLVVEPVRSNARFNLPSISAVENAVESYELIDAILFVRLAEPISTGESVTLSLTYELSLPQGPGLLGWSERQTNLVDWYPYIPPFREESGWLVHEPTAVGEHGVYEAADFDVHIEVLNAPASLQLAGPAPAVHTGDMWDFSLRSARRFAWSASGHYETLHSTHDGIPVSVYFFAEQRDAAEAALEVARQALDAYSDLFGPYPYKSLTIVEALFPDGMESDGLFFLDQYYFTTYTYDRRNYLTTLIAHEVAHNWWFGQVGNDQALEPWLDEAFCIYSELLYYERFYPDLAASWWWNFRIERFNPGGWVDSSIYEHSTFESYVQAVYMRGALFLRDVRAAIGDDRFFATLRDHADYGSSKIVSDEEFFWTLAYQMNTDLTPIVNEYFRLTD